jgi:drug/metabolite transporter (DMT)-like permease
MELLMRTGILFILLAELFFTISSAIAKHIASVSGVSAIEVSFMRFVVGLLCMTVFISVKKWNIIPHKIPLVILRGVFNTVAVILFFHALRYTTVTNANMLNMTYPLFVFILSPLINRERSAKIYYLFLFTALSGIYLIAFPDFSHVNIGDMFALLSGIVAAFGVTTLRQAGKYDDPYIILLYLMLFGTVINGAVVMHSFVIPGTMIAFLVLIAAVLGFAGQVFLTVAYRIVDARNGALTSSSRAVFSIIIGAVIFLDPFSIPSAIGCALITVSLVVMSGFFEKFIPIIKRILKGK